MASIFISKQILPRSTTTSTTSTTTQLLLSKLQPKVSTRGAAKLTSLSVVSTIPTTTPTLKHSSQAAHARKLLPARTGALAKKLGMVTWFTPEGQMFPCTVLQVDRCQVTHHKLLEKDGYAAVQVGMEDIPPTKFMNPQTGKLKPNSNKIVSRPLLGHFARAQVAPKRHVAEFLVKNDECVKQYPLGQLIEASHFQVGQYVDLKSVSKGKGFQGVMKRHGFHGLGASHGVSLAHRSAGSTGMNQDPGRVLPGKKMPGHMGVETVTIQNSLVVDVNEKRGLILIKGPVSGPKGAVVRISDAKKKLPEYLGTDAQN